MGKKEWARGKRYFKMRFFSKVAFVTIDSEIGLWSEFFVLDVYHLYDLKILLGLSRRRKEQNNSNKQRKK